MALKGDVTGAELEVLKALWRSGDRTIRELADELYPGGDTAHYATVQKLLERLGDKGAVSRERCGRSHVYRATVERADLIAHELRAAAARLTDGALAPLLSQLVQSERLTDEELRQLRALVDRLGDGREATP